MTILETENQIRERVGSLRQYERIAVGAGVNLHWLHKYSQGRIPNPGIKAVAALEEYFKKMDSEEI